MTIFSIALSSIAVALRTNTSVAAAFAFCPLPTQLHLVTRCLITGWSSLLLYPAAGSHTS
jgi:hypothetical protein